MDYTHKLLLLLALSSSLALFMIVFLICVFTRKGFSKERCKDSNFECKESGFDEKGDLIRFEGGEDLSCFDILDAPGEVIGKSCYGTLYRANLVTSDVVLVLRFLRPACTVKVQDLMHVVQVLGSIRHPNLVPLCGFYVGPGGEKLLVHPFYQRGNLAQFIRDENGESHKWTVIYRISIGIARGLHHLHTSLQKPIIHGNLKSKNILLGRNHHPFLSDFGLNLLLNPSATQEMLEDASIEGYNPPESIISKNTSVESDIFNFGVILFELMTGKEPVKNDKEDPDQDLYSNAMLDHRILDPVDEEQIMKLFQLAMACCSFSPSFRPDMKHVCKKLEEIGSC